MAGVINSVTIGTVSVTDASYNVLDDTAVSSSGGYLKITGTGFKPGCTVYIGGSPAASTTYVSGTEVRATTSVLASNTYLIYVLNTDNTIGIKLNALVVSGTPSWNTGATLGGQLDGVTFSVQLSATSDSSITYSLAAGSSVPSGTTLYSNGLFTGTVSGLSSETTYSFGVVATDTELQDVSRTFSVTVSVGDPFFYLTPLYINGEANTWVTDSSNNRFATVTGNTMPSAFSPYNTKWSTFFDGSDDYVTYGNTSLMTFGTAPYTIEFWYHGDPSIADYKVIIHNGTMAVFFNNSGIQIWNGANPVSQPSMTVPKNKWTFIQIIRSSTSTGGLNFYLDGSLAALAATDATNWTATGTVITSYQVGWSRAINGYVSDFRISNTARTPGIPSSPLSSDANTTLLTFQSRRFLDNSSGNTSVTPTNGPLIKSFSPYSDTDTTTGSGYFDGTGDYLNYSVNTSLDLTQTDFTIDAWIYRNVAGAAHNIYSNRSASVADGLEFRVNANNTLQVFYTGAGNSLTSTGTLSAGQWYHVAAVRSSTTVYLFINGVLDSNTSIGNGTVGTGTPKIGVDNGGTSGFNGYIADLRVTRGTALYTSTFTPPTSSLTAVSNTSLLTLQSRIGHNNVDIIDESGRKNIVVRTGNATQGTLTPFSSDDLYWSQSYANTSYRSYAAMSTSIIDFKSTATFTVEGWINLTGVGSTGHIMLATTDFSSTVNWYMGVDPTSRKMVVYWYTSGVVTCVGTTVLDYGKWYFLQFRANNGAITMGLNGVQETLTGTTTLGSPGNSTYLSLGLERTFAGPCMLYDVRVSNTVRSFNLPTTPMSSDANTTLLTARRRSIKDDSSLNTTLLTSGLTQPYTPFGRGTRTEYSRTTHGGSVYFDGSGDKLNTTFSPVLTLGTTDHTFEFWMFPNGAQNSYGVIWEYSSGATLQATNDYYFAINSTGPSITLLLGGSGVWAVNISLTAADYNAALNNWTHVVITRSGSAFRLFFNGVLKGYATSSQSIAAQGSSFVLGDDGGGNSFKGYISDFSMKLGTIPTAYQTASTTTGTAIFTPPTAPVSVAGADIMHYNFTAAGVYDTSGRTMIETTPATSGYGTCRLSNVSKYGNSSIFFSGSYQWCYIGNGNPPLLPTLGDFTVECWIYPTTSDITLMALNTLSSAFAALRVGLNANGTIGLLSSTNNSTWVINTTSSACITYNAWQHVAFVRNGGNVVIYHNGSAVLTSTALGATTALMAGSESILGALDFRNNADFISFYNGYIDDFRVTNTARYTGNFTAPTTTFLAR
jgi:hypothetical protein